MAYQPMKMESRHRGSTLLWWILGLLGLLLLLGFVWALVAGGDEAEVDETTVSKILYNPEAYDGRVVTVLGQVQERMTPASFLLQEQDEVLPEALLVVSSTGAPVTVEEGAPVAVTGTLRILEASDLEARVGRTLRGDAAGGWGGQPVLLATGVSMRPTGEGY